MRSVQLTTGNPCLPRQMCLISCPNSRLWDPAAALSHAWTETKVYFAARHGIYERPTVWLLHSQTSSLQPAHDRLHNKVAAFEKLQVRYSAFGRMRPVLRNVRDATSPLALKFDVRSPSRGRNFRARLNATTAAFRLTSAYAKQSRGAKITPTANARWR